MGATHDTHTLGFLGLSGMLHTALAVFLMLYAVDMIQKPKPELIEFEVLSSPHLAMPNIAAAPESPKGKQIEEPTVAKEAVSVPAKSHKTHFAKPSVKATANAEPATAPVSPLANLSADDISVPVPELETVELNDTPILAAAPELEDSAMAEDFARVDQESGQQNAAQLADLRADVDAETAVALEEQSRKMSALEKRNQQEAQKVAAAAADREAREKSDAIARAQALAAARAQMASDARSRAAERAAAAAAAAQAAAMQAAPAKSYGSVEGVRALEDLRQKPGNKKPKYDSEDRFQKRQGEVRFLAYVTKEGTLSKIKPLKLTGHRTLDLKTLKAIKQWRFYPGQEGWVEIPYIWNLKGEPQEMGGGLRTKVGQNR
jgi:TonB family protein